MGRAREGDVETVRALLSKDGVDLNTRDSTGAQALTAALSGKDEWQVECSHLKMVDVGGVSPSWLAQEGTDVNSSDISCPPLHHAIMT